MAQPKSQFASATTVAADRTRAEIEALVTRAGATQFVSAWDAGKRTALIMFRLADRMVRFVLTMPDPETLRKVVRRGYANRRTDEQVRAAWDQLVRQRWRVLLLVIKAKLEAVATGLRTVEQEFLSDILTPDGQTVGELMAVPLKEAYLTGRLADLPLLGHHPAPPA